MLTLTDLRKAYGATVAVDGLSLRVEPGEILGLLGPNGAGKSTTVHLALGLLSPDAGIGHGRRARAADRRGGAPPPRAGARSRWRSTPS